MTTVTIDTSTINADTTVNIDLGDKVIVTGWDLGSNGYGLYGSTDSYPNGLPASLQNTDLWRRLGNRIYSGGPDGSGYYFVTADDVELTFPLGTYSLIQILSYGSDDHEFGAYHTITLNVNPPEETIALTAGHNYLLMSNANISASLTGSDLTVEYYGAFDLIDLGKKSRTDAPIVLIAAANGISRIRSPSQTSYQLFSY